MTNEIIMASHWKGKSTDSTQSPIPTPANLDSYKDTGFNAVVFAEVTYNGQRDDFNAIFAGTNGWSKTNNPIKTTIDNIHARGMKAFFNMNPNRYGGKSGFLNRTADYAQFMRDLEYIVSLGIDGIDIEEGFWTTAAGGTYAKVNQFSRDIRAKAPRPIILTATPSFNTTAQCVANNWDYTTLNNENIYDYIAPQPGKGSAPDYLIENSRIQSSYNFWSGVHPNAKTMPGIYKLYGTNSGSVYNVNLITNSSYVINKGWGLILWPAEFLTADDKTALKAIFPASPTPETGFIDIKTTPQGASIEYNGVLQSAVTNTVISGVVPGVVHTVVLKKQGYDDITKTVLVSEGLTAYIDETLTSTEGTLNITSTPTGASIKIKKTSEQVWSDYGTTNNVITISPGSYEATLEYGQYPIPTLPFTITAGQTTTIDHQFEEIPPPALKWKCSGAPDYTCVEAEDGTYDTQAQCQEACKAPPPPKKDDGELAVFIGIIYTIGKIL